MALIAVGRSTQLGLTSHRVSTAMPAATVKVRARRLNAWSRSLDSTIRKHPPALPAIPRFGAVAVPTYAVPAATPVGATIAQTPAPKRARKVTTIRFVTARTPPKDSSTDRGSSDTPSDPVPAPPTTTTTAPPAPTVAAAPAPAPPVTTSTLRRLRPTARSTPTSPAATVGTTPVPAATTKPP